MKIYSKAITFLIGIIFCSCNSLKKIDFPEYIDTSNKKIEFQKKQIYHLEKLGILASNNFDAARLNDLKMINDTLISVVIKPENSPINNSAYYNFKLWSKQPKNIYVKFVYPNEYSHRYFPKVYKNKKWQLLDSTKTKIINKDFIMNLELSNDTTWISAQEPISFKDTKKWYEKLALNNENILIKNIGKSVLGRQMQVMQISKKSTKNKPVIVLLTRQHPPEVTGYFAFQEFVSTLVDESEISNNFFDNYTVLAFPILNPDGVDLGNWRHNANGVDLNRDWSKYNQKEIKNVITFLEKYKKQNNSQIILGLDFHSTWYDVFYTNDERKSTTLPNFINNWFTALEKELANYKVNEASSNSNKPVSKGWFLLSEKAVGITYEIGDDTNRKRIKEIGNKSAIEMMKLLVNK